MERNENRKDMSTISEHLMETELDNLAKCYEQDISRELLAYTEKITGNDADGKTAEQKVEKLSGNLLNVITSANLTAFKLGYTQGKSEHKLNKQELDLQNIVSDAVLKIQKASTVLRTTIEANLLDRTDLGHDEIIAIGANLSNICNLIVVADDYIYHAQKELEDILK